MPRKLQFVFLAGSLLLLGGVALLPQYGGPVDTKVRTLSNGIVLLESWPPRRAPTQEVLRPPYLVSPPEVIPIDVGRQLFVDDFLIEHSTLQRTAHRPVFFEGNPVIAARSGPDRGAFAAPQSDGVWFDAREQLFRAWYWGGGSNGLAYAYSHDGERWIRPALDDPPVPEYPHMVIRAGGGRASGTTWIDRYTADADERYKAFIYTGSRKQSVWFSPDGIQWDRQNFQIESVSDRTTFFYNPFRRVWVESARAKLVLPSAVGRPERLSRSRVYRESENLRDWTPPDEDAKAVFWAAPDELDPPYPGTDSLPELYNLDAVAYESLLVGLFTWYYPAPEANLLELGVGFSRDGFHWSRPTRGGRENAFIPATNQAGEWNAFNTQSAGGCFLIVGDELWFYFSGRDKRHGTPMSDWTVSTGLAKLRRDGFYSMDAGHERASLTTRPVIFHGQRLFVNAAIADGDLRVELLEPSGRPIPGFTYDDATPISQDSTLIPVRWGANVDLSQLAGRAVRVRFHLRAGSLYSFWVSADSSGASGGYVAAGGPEFPGPTDGTPPEASP